MKPTAVDAMKRIDLPRETPLADIVSTHLDDARTVHSPAHVHGVESALKRIQTDLEKPRVRDLTVGALLARRKNRLTEGVGHATINREESALRAALNWAARYPH